MISKKMLSPLLIAAGFAAFPALSAEPDRVIVVPADAVASDVTPDVSPDGTNVEVAPLQASQDEVPTAYESDDSDGAYRSRSQPPLENAANPLGANSKVNPLLPSPG